MYCTSARCVTNFYTSQIFVKLFRLLNFVYENSNRIQWAWYELWGCFEFWHFLYNCIFVSQNLLWSTPKAKSTCTECKHTNFNWYLHKVQIYANIIMFPRQYVISQLHRYYFHLTRQEMPPRWVWISRNEIIVHIFEPVSRSVATFVQSDQSLWWTLHGWSRLQRVFRRRAKALIRLCWFPAGFDSSLYAHAILYLMLDTSSSRICNQIMVNLQRDSIPVGELNSFIPINCISCFVYELW